MARSGGVHALLDELWGVRLMSDDGIERRRGYSAVAERLAAVETKQDISMGELGLLRPVVHRVVSELSTLVLQGEQHARDHAALSAKIEQFGSRIEQHDERDDTRFTGDGKRISALESKVEHIESAEARTTAWHHAVYPALIAAGAALIVALLSPWLAHLMGVGVRL